MSAQIEEVASRSWDVIVVGAGPAGALTARELARRGRSVLLVDRAPFPRYKVCGGCLNARALSALSAAGLDGFVERLGGIPLHALCVGAGGRRVRVTLPGGMAVSREAFDAALVESARDYGAMFLPETSAFVNSPCADARVVHLRQPHATLETRTHLVIAADGLAGRLLRVHGFQSPPEDGSRVGAGTICESAPPDYAPGVIHMACAKGGYVGLVRVEGDRLNVGAAFEVDFLRQSGGMEEAAAAILQEAGFPPIRGMEGLPWRGTPALTREATLLSVPRAFVVGDAAGYVEPFTGEGMAWALTAALALAPIADRALDGYDPSFGREWERVYHHAVRNRQYVCRMLAAGLRRPRLLRIALPVVAALPIVARPFLHHMNRGFNPQGSPSK